MQMRKFGYLYDTPPAAAEYQLKWASNRGPLPMKQALYSNLRHYSNKSAEV